MSPAFNVEAIRYEGDILLHFKDAAITRFIYTARTRGSYIPDSNVSPTPAPTHFLRARYARAPYTNPAALPALSL